MGGLDLNQDIRYHIRSCDPATFASLHSIQSYFASLSLRKKRKRTQTFAGMGIVLFECILYLSCEVANKVLLYSRVADK